MIKQIGIISGKGGTGKSTIAASFIALEGDLVMADCDVDAPDLHILLHPEIRSTRRFQGSDVALIDADLCTVCGECEERCRFDAPRPPSIDPLRCEGCAVCEYVCPERAITMTPRLSGHLYSSRTRFGPMAHARLNAGEGNSGKLVTEVRKLAEELAEESGKTMILLDGSPGIGCPVIATVTGLSFGVIVTEPTLSGIHDMQRVIDLLNRFNTPAGVIINKYDLSMENTMRIEELCIRDGIEVLGRVPFDSITTMSMVAATTLPEYAPDHPVTATLEIIWKKICELTDV